MKGKFRTENELRQILKIPENIVPTLEKNSPYAISLSDFARLENLPLGISAHVMVKNEPATIEAAILSVLPAVDEVIVTVNAPSADDETYRIVENLAKKHEKIRLFLYAVTIVPTQSSHEAHSPEVAETLAKFEKNFVDPKKSYADACLKIPPNSVHSLAHARNFSLVKSRYNHYIKIDADHIYFTKKLQALREAVFAANDFTMNRTRGTFRRVLGKLLEPTYPLLAHLGIKNYIKILSLINGRLAISCGGLNIGKSSYEKPFRVQDLSDCIVALNPDKNSGAIIFNGADHVLVPLDPTMVYEMHENGGENLRYSVPKNVLCGGIFSFHYGFHKRAKIFAPPDGKNSITVTDYIKTPVRQILKNAIVRKEWRTEVRHVRENLRAFKKIDDKFMRDFLENPGF